MTKRDVVRQVFDGKHAPYVPWQFSFTAAAKEKLKDHFGASDLDTQLDNHCVVLGNPIGFFEQVGASRFRDSFGVEWDRAVEQDIGNVVGSVLPEPTLAGYSFPDPIAPRYFQDIPQLVERYSDRFRTYTIGFSLYERAWTLRGMQNLMMDFLDHPDFVHQLLTAITDWNIAHVQEALKHDIDCVYFGDDWGQQSGLQMGPRIWHEFLRPAAERMYRVVREAGRYVMIHSCGDVDELFDDLIAMGVNCFSPFQPEVMDVAALLARYRGRLAFHGGISTQITLPYGTAGDVTRETERLIGLGRDGGYILAPAHDVPKDVPLENMLAFINAAQAQQR